MPREKDLVYCNFDWVFSGKAISKTNLGRNPLRWLSYNSLTVHFPFLSHRHPVMLAWQANAILIPLPPQIPCLQLPWILMGYVQSVTAHSETHAPYVTQRRGASMYDVLPVVCTILFAQQVHCSVVGTPGHWLLARIADSLRSIDTSPLCRTKIKVSSKLLLGLDITFT